MSEGYWSVPPCFKGETIVCIGGGPSLTAEDVDHVRGKARVIAVNDAYKLAPWADVLYACDRKWWGWHDGVPGFQGLKLTLEAPEYPGIRQLRNTGAEGYDPDLSCLRTGSNSGYQAIHLAVHFGAARVVLLGYDMKLGGNGETHWFGEHPVATKPSVFESVMLPRFETLRAPLAALGVEVINASRDTALTLWPMKPIDEVF